ncbi:MAG TPA: hypothetical protein VKR06_13780 [Ktedonosporobacter sp.]|nr:hypothetical protein [Ktedonosporobacter sp.]
MTYSTGNGSAPYDPSMDPASISFFPKFSQLETPEQIRGFELLRLAFFALKLRKLERGHVEEEGIQREPEYEFRCNLLRHAVFQQVLALKSLGAHDEAIRIIEECRR